MTLQEAIKSGKPFKRKSCALNRWIENPEDIHSRLYWDDGFAFVLSVEDILADDWIVKEEWYEGHFKKKWPNGVLCWMWDNDKREAEMHIVVEYLRGRTYPFITGDVGFMHAEPVKQDEAPAIIGE